MNIHAILRAMRPHHWTKNMLVFLPLIAGHELFVAPVFFKAVLAFVGLCLFASAGYLINDCFDLDSDRTHPLKRSRPLAKGLITMRISIILALVLAVMGVLVSLQINTETTVVLVFYFLFALVYSSILKKWLFLDILSLSGLFLVRMIAGHEASGIPFSAWLLGFAMFFFLSLACLKRCAELQRLKKDGHSKSIGRGYVIEDLPVVTIFGIVSGYISVLIFALYINSANVLILYSRPLVLWLVCPLLLYWISRIWLLSHRGLVPEDPVPFMFLDKKNYLLLAMLAGILVVAT